MSEEDLTKFKFYFLNKKSNRHKHMMSKKGYLTKTDLMLDGRKVPLIFISYTSLRGKRIKFGLQPTNQLDDLINKSIKNNTLTLEFTGKHVSDLKRKIDNNLSFIIANIHKGRLEQEGKGESFRSYICPNCSSTIDVTRYTDTDEIYCRFCYSIMDKGNNIISNGNEFGLCDQCNLYSATKKYYIFLFYFFLIVYGFRYQDRNLCANCASKIGKKNLLLNMIFLIGVPWSLLMIIKAHRHSDNKKSILRKANKSVKAGLYQEADKYIDELKTIFPSNHPGIIYNQAIAHINGKDQTKGYDYLTESLNYCSNYSPALTLKSKIQRQRA